MPNVFKRSVSGQTLSKKLSGTVYKAGTNQRFTQKGFQKQLQQSSNPLLRRKLGFNKGGTIQKHQALQTAEAFYKEAAEKKEAYKLDEYKLKKEGLKVEGGKISKLSSQRMYQSMSQEELKAEAPKGPSKEELEKEKNRQRALAQMNKWRRAREIDLEEKQKAQAKGALGKQGPGQQGAQGPAQPHAGARSAQPKNLHIPTMASGSIGRMQKQDDQQSVALGDMTQPQPTEGEVNPLINRVKEEGATDPAVDPKIADSDIADATPANQTVEAPAEETKETSIAEGTPEEPTKAA